MTYYFRRVLGVLDGMGPATLDALARKLTDRDFDGSGLTPTSADYARTRRELQSVYLPQLLEADLVADRRFAGHDLFVRARAEASSDPISIPDVV